MNTIRLSGLCVCVWLLALSSGGCCKLLSGGDCGGARRDPTLPRATTPDHEAAIRARETRAQQDAEYRRMLSGEGSQLPPSRVSSPPPYLPPPGPVPAAPKPEPPVEEGPFVPGSSR